MFKKLGLAIIGLSLMCSNVMAESINVIDMFKAAPNFKQGVMFNMDKNEFEYISTMPVMKSDPFTVELGYATDNSLIGVVSYELYNASKNGVDVPILDLIKCNVGIAAGMNRIGSGEGNNEFVWGLTATLMELNF